MNILLIGSGGREHAIAYKLTQSALCDQLYILPGNAGTKMLGINVPGNPLDFDFVKSKCLEYSIGLVVVGPEDPLVKGIRNYFMSDTQLQHILFVGPDAAGAQMEGSKDWSKTFMKKYGIPTAAYKTFTTENLHQGIDYVSSHALPVVLKADGLAAGKGVLICETHDEAVAGMNALIRDRQFGDASSRVVVEEFLAGIELSVFVLTDGKSYKILPEAKDYKRIGEGDKGLNTGGMGSISPVPFADATFMKKVEDRIIIPTIHGLISEDIKYQGFIFIGLIKVGEEPMVIEYNCRLGDPETESVLPRISSDFTEMMIACASGKLDEYELQLSKESTATVMLVSAGYPGEYEKGKVMSGFKDVKNVLLFHAGTKEDEQQQILTNGGRVLAVTAQGENISTALSKALLNCEKIIFDGKYYRKDIGYEFID